ncbi:glutathione S-transferase family protein [Phenylobacterium sp.]|uniref:glutathione S-transferase family protein n=1 Tax=Phenylobacterium sp. TaxID=1871053 RepID=UPI0027203137|nr:glutathione S-transferase family protein [Phenylobacterium sp.]MDO8800504.1 glutathione S-transferase family protein [Phenylobacterium sp.]
MSDQLVFYTNPMSRGRIIRWLMEEVGQPYETQVLDFPAMKAPAYLAVNPMGKVPAIKHGDTVITECAAICAYMADAFPEAGLAPPVGSKLRGEYYRWLFFAAGPLEAAITVKSLGFEVPADQQASAGWGSFGAVMDTLEKALTGREYLAGDRFTAADLYVGAHLGWGLQFGSIEARPVFKAYSDRMAGRPAAVRAREIDDALIAAAHAPA